MVAVTLGQLCPDICPPHLTDHPAAHINAGTVYPLGSVAAHFIKKQWEVDAGKATTNERAIHVENTSITERNRLHR